MEKNLQEIIEGTFTIWAVSTTSARFKARLRPEDLNLQESDIDQNIRLGQKDMISEKDRVYLGQAPGQVAGFMKAVSRRFFGRGLYMVPENKILACLEGLKRIKEAQRERVEEFLERYPEEQRRQNEAHPNLKGERWPTPEDVREFFSISWQVFKLSTVEGKSADPEELIRAKGEFQEELKKGYAELKEEILGQAYTEILSAVDSISAKLDKGDKLTETNFKRPRQVIDQYLTISSVFDLPAVKAKVEELKAVMEGTAAADIRRRPYVAKQFAAKVQGLSKDLETMTGYSADGRMKRTLDLEDDEPQEPGPKPQTPETPGGFYTAEQKKELKEVFGVDPSQSKVETAGMSAAPPRGETYRMF